MKKKWKAGETFTDSMSIFEVTGFDARGDRVSRRLGSIGTVEIIEKVDETETPLEEKTNKQLKQILIDAGKTKDLNKLRNKTDLLNAIKELE